ncbi:hypothetical protein BDV09DRAFT_193988 [Aspergillus tetrazonus]
MSLSKADTDVILNKANIALARSQRLVASWLPAAPATGEDNAKTDAELQKEEEEIFTAVPETLGLGAPLPTKAADGSWNRRELDSNDELRRQLLGRNYKRVMAEKEKARQKTADPASKNHASKGAPGHNQQGSGVGENEDIDDDDEGRAASISKNASSRKRKVGGSAEPTTRTEGADSETKYKDSEEENTASSQGLRAKGRKKATSFLDEILAERSKKRKKR